MPTSEAVRTIIARRSFVEKPSILINPDAPRGMTAQQRAYRATISRYHHVFKRRQKDLVAFCRHRPQMFAIVSEVVEYYESDRFYADMSQLGGCDEVRHWNRVARPRLLRKIVEMYKSELNAERTSLIYVFVAVRLALTHLFIANGASHPQEKLDELYACIEAGHLTDYLRELDTEIGEIWSELSEE